ncbi:hypothetical protein I6M76_08210 [Citrobacter cronae]|uniref:hypothetical protein n=1 Tax=Citrobacter cronae TaxID=1748967 RepID=UPI001901032B|nr:hypothetical protein [Citrobacter cronae]MBJ8362580.1 hypothetical protein [Citrobacter cronae]
MHYRELYGKTGKVILYSPDFIKSKALESLQKANDEYDVYIQSDVSLLIADISKINPEYLVMDISAHSHVHLLCAIRRQFPTLPLILTRKYHLFSDHVSATWFGNIWLRDYDSLMGEFPALAPTDCVTNIGLSGTESAGACTLYCTGKSELSQILSPMRLWLAHRLRARIASRKAVNIIFSWLEMGGSAREMGESISRSDKLIYHYRWQIMRELGIRNVALEFSPSLSLSAGPVPLDCSCDCLMRVCNKKEYQSEGL